MKQIKDRSHLVGCEVGRKNESGKRERVDGGGGEVFMKSEDYSNSGEVALLPS